jgi:hypothetical protein
MAELDDAVAATAVEEMKAVSGKEWIAKGLVPVKSKQTLYDLVKKRNDGVDIPSIWGKLGRPRLVASDETFRA